MTRIEKTIEIKAPMENVFAYVTDVENVAKNQPPEIARETQRQVG